MPCYGALVTNCDLDRGRAKGVSRWWPGAGRHPRRTAPRDAAGWRCRAGLGTSPYAPVRFACRPEATLLTLVAALTGPLPRRVAPAGVPASRGRRPAR